MNRSLWLRASRLAFGMLGLVAVVMKYGHDGDTFANWLSKFTIQGNTIAALVLIAGAIFAGATAASVTWDRVRGAVVMYMVMVFIVYGVLIGGFDDPFDTSRHWTHTVLHQLMPLVIVVDFALSPVLRRLTWRDALGWCVYPIVFLIYSLTRGAFIDWYPYNFTDPHKVGGYGGVALYSLGITAGFVALASLVVRLSNWREERASRRATPATPLLPTDIRLPDIKDVEG